MNSSDSALSRLRPASLRRTRCAESAGPFGTAGPARRTRRATVVVAAVAVLALTLGACGGDDSAPKASTPPTSAPAAGGSGDSGTYGGTNVPYGEQVDKARQVGGEVSKRQTDLDTQSSKDN